MSFSEHLAEDRRLVILRILSEAPHYRANSAVLQMSLDGFGHNVSRDRVHTDLAWLAEQGLVTSTPLHSIEVATLTQRGRDAAAGAVTIPGVKRPGPRG